VYEKIYKHFTIINNNNNKTATTTETTTLTQTGLYKDGWIHGC